MTYVINPSVRIADVEYNNKTINGVTLTAGRTTVDEQPRAGYATINLVTPNNTYPNIEINQRVTVRVDDSNGNDVVLWRGWVSDVATTLGPYGASGWLQQQQITAVGSLSKLNRRIVGGGGYPKEFDGDRVHEIIFETAGTTWDNWTPSNQQWEDVDPLLSWNTSDLLIGDIDRPGDFELYQYSAGEASGLALAQTMAASGLGILYETADGKISYDDYTSRTDDVSANGFTTIPADAILSAGLSSVSRLSDLANDVEITYKANATERLEDTNSIALYGRYSAKIATQLEKQVDAEQRAQYYLDTRAFPRRELQQIRLALHLDQVADADRDALLPMRVSKPIRITSLPTSIYPEIFAGFVEGYTWTINRNELFLTLNVSEYGFSQLEMNWLQVPPTLEWQDVSATLEWQEARVVA
jgi:hypothetical protein